MTLSLPDCKISYYEDYLTPEKSNNLFNHLKNIPLWNQRSFRMFGRLCKQNRKTCSFSLDNLNYRYNGMDNIGDNIKDHPCLYSLLKELNAHFKMEFNYILANYYKDGSSNIGMHSDDERGLDGPIISISLGADRFFDIQHKKDKSLRKRLTLKNGSMLVMDGETQKNYKHGIPVQKKILLPRINLTFRCVVNS